MKILTMFLSLVIVSLVVGCNIGPSYPRGFSLPEGEPKKGQTVIFQHNCLSCHSVQGLGAEAETVELEIAERVPLGGRTMSVTTYAALVTSIINPSHRISRAHKSFTTDQDGQSVMTNYNDVMTVTERLDA